MEDPCPKCGSHDISGLQGSFWRAIDEDGSPKFQWADEESSSEMTEWRCCRDCDHEWALDEWTENTRRLERAAPELLEAAKGALLKIESADWNDADSPEAIQLRAAIAKAEGGVL